MKSTQRKLKFAGKNYEKLSHKSGAPFSLTQERCKVEPPSYNSSWWQTHRCSTVANIFTKVGGNVYTDRNIVFEISIYEFTLSFKTKTAMFKCNSKERSRICIFHWGSTSLDLLECLHGQISQVSTSLKKIVVLNSSCVIRKIKCQ